MNEDEIKKALKCCQDYDYESCVDCPYRKHSEDCTNDILKDALKLITEQEKDYSKLQEMFANYQLASDKEIRAQVKQAKIDVLNRLKERYGYSSCYSWGNDVRSLNVIIDEFIKEIEK